MDALIAIDVAILPPPQVSDAAVALSASLPRSESQGLVLGARHLPHITLTQQFVPAAELDNVGTAIGGVLKERLPLRLEVAGAGRGSRSVWMQIAPAAQLADLHVALMQALKPFERRGADATAFAGGDPRPGDIRWVAGFRTASSFARYTPHITLGHAAALPSVTPITFNADHIALCHLGRFCTCQTALQSWRLTSSDAGSRPDRDSPSA